MPDYYELSIDGTIWRNGIAFIKVSPEGNTPREKAYNAAIDLMRLLEKQDNARGN